MAVLVEKSGGNALIRMNGRFDVNSILGFRNAVRPLLSDPETQTLVIDFAQVSFVDSSALGVMLLLREQAQDNQKSVKLIHCGPELHRVLLISQFDRLFIIEK